MPDHTRVRGHHLERSIVRIWNRVQAKVVGIGSLLTGSRVLTCAHVVEQAWGKPYTLVAEGDRLVEIDFPLLTSLPSAAAAVTHWQGPDDMALLTLTEAPPIGAIPLRYAAFENVVGERFEAYGCPYDTVPTGTYHQPLEVQHVGGVWAQGELRRVQAHGFLQCDQAPGVTTYRVQGGFSGGPVWVERLNVAVAIVARYDQAVHGHAAYAIPMGALFERFPDLRQHASDPVPVDPDAAALLAAAAERVRTLLVEEAAALGREREFAPAAAQLMAFARGEEVKGPKFSRAFSRGLHQLERRVGPKIDAIEFEVKQLFARLERLRQQIGSWSREGPR
ncbi:MAG: trypsin-like peptidase domain-containing protein [Gemmataceae bacterium]